MNPILRSCLLALSLVSASHADTTAWQAGNSTWDESGDWTNGRPVAGVDFYVNNGGLVRIQGEFSAAANLGVLGSASGESGSLWVRDNSSLALSDELRIGDAGTGTFTLSDGTATVDGGIKIAVQTGSTGTLNFGSSNLASPTTAGTLNTGSITFGDGTGVINFNQTNTITVAADISGNGKLVQRGSGTTTLTGATTLTLNDGFAGATTINQGTLVLDGSDASLTQSNAAIIVGDSSGDLGAFLIAGGATASSYRGYLGLRAGAFGSATLRGTGTQWENAASLAVGYEGNGSLWIEDGAKAISGEGYVAFATGSDAGVTITGEGSEWQSGDAFHVGRSGSGTLNLLDGGKVSVDNGDGTVNVATFTGSNGTINFGDHDLTNPTTAGTLDAKKIVFGAGTGVINFNQTNNVTLAADISGGGSVVQRGEGESALTGTNTYTGGTTITDGSIVALNDSALGSGSVTIDGGKLRAGDGNTIANAISVEAAGGEISNYGAFAQTTFTGATTLAGNLRVEATSAAPGKVAVTGGITGTGDVTLVTDDSAGIVISGAAVNHAGALTHEGNGPGTATVQSVIGANVTSVTQNSNSTLILTADNLYTGPTTVEKGTLLVNGSITSNVSVKNGATFGGAGSAGEIILESGATMTPGENSAIGTFGGISLTWNPDATLAFDLGATTSDLLDLSGSLVKGGDGTFQFAFRDAGWQEGQTYTLINFDLTNFSETDFSFVGVPGGFNGTFSFNGDSLQFTLVAIPEPSTWALGLLGLLGTAVLIQRKQPTAARD